jgi:hypothetical protein
MAHTLGHKGVVFRAIQDALARQQVTLCTIRGMARGSRRRAVLMQWMRTPDETGGRRRIPVNNKWQLNTLDDPDLQHLLKHGLLMRERDGGGRRNPRNRSSGKRQTYLVLAP